MKVGGIIFDILFVIIQFILFVLHLNSATTLYEFEEGTTSILLGIYILNFGLVFLLTYYAPNFSKITSICERIIAISIGGLGRKVAIFYFLLALSSFAVCILFGIGIF